MVRLDHKLMVKSEVGPVPDIIITALEKSIERRFILDLELKLLELIQQLSKGIGIANNVNKYVNNQENHQGRGNGGKQFMRQNVMVPLKELRNNYYRALMHKICDYYKLSRSEAATYFNIHSRDDINYVTLQLQINKGGCTLKEIYGNRLINKDTSMGINEPINGTNPEGSTSIDSLSSDNNKDGKSTTRPKMLIRSKCKESTPTEQLKTLTLHDNSEIFSSKEKLYEEKRREIFENNDGSDNELSEDETDADDDNEEDRVDDYTIPSVPSTESNSPNFYAPQYQHIPPQYFAVPHQGTHQGTHQVPYPQVPYYPVTGYIPNQPLPIMSPYQPYASVSGYYPPYIYNDHTYGHYNGSFSPYPDKNVGPMQDNDHYGTQTTYQGGNRKYRNNVHQSYNRKHRNTSSATVLIPHNANNVGDYDATLEDEVDNNHQTVQPIQDPSATL